MVDVYKAIGMDFSPNVSINEVSINVAQENDPNTLIDDDLVLNPGESATLNISLENEIGWVDAISLEAVLSTNSNFVSIVSNNASYGFLPDGSVSSGYFEFSLSDDAPVSYTHLRAHET